MRQSVAPESEQTLEGLFSDLERLLGDLQPPADAQKPLNALYNKIRELQDHIAWLTFSNNDFFGQNQSMFATIQSLQSELDQLIFHLNQRIATLPESTQELLAAYNRLKAQVSDQKASIEGLSAEVARLTEAATASTFYAQTAKAEKKELFEENVELRRRLALLQQEPAGKQRPEDLVQSWLLTQELEVPGSESWATASPKSAAFESCWSSAGESIDLNRSSFFAVSAPPAAPTDASFLVIPKPGSSSL